MIKKFIPTWKAEHVLYIHTYMYSACSLLPTTIHSVYKGKKFGGPLYSAFPFHCVCVVYGIDGKKMLKRNTYIGKLPSLLLALLPSFSLPRRAGLGPKLFPFEIVKFLCCALSNFSFLFFNDHAYTQHYHTLRDSVSPEIEWVKKRDKLALTSSLCVYTACTTLDSG